jgi:iron complex outermembrane receptor protein
MKKQKVNYKTENTLVFKQWRRKGYSVFLTISRVVLISVLSVNYLLAVPTEGLETVQTDTTATTKEYKLDEIEISAQRSPALYSQVARVVTVISAKEIEAAPAQNIQELLKYVAGIDVRQRGADGIQADISIRGGTFDQTLILLNGVNITDPQTGHHNLNIPIPFNQIERIEILEGPAARVYGPNAFSGAINIVTRSPRNKMLMANISTGSYKYFDTDLAGNFSTGNLLHSISMNYRKSDGYISNTDFNDKGIYYLNNYENKSGKLTLQAGYSDKEFGANSFYTPKYPNQFEEVKSLVSSVKWESNSKLHLTPLIYWRRHQDRFELFRENPPAWYTTHNYHLTDTYGGNLNSWVQWKFGKSAFGVEYRSENILSNVLGKPLDEPVEVPGEQAFFTKSDSRNTISGFIEHVYYADKWIVSAGLMANYISGSGRGINIFPGIEASYQLSSSFKVFGNYNTSLRMPTFTDLYYSGPTNIGNPDLNPELTSAFETGLNYNSKIINGRIVIYYKKGHDIIDWVKLEQTDKWQPQNLTELSSYGTEIQAQANLEKAFGRFWPERFAVNWLFSDISKDESEYISYYVLDYLKNKINISLEKEIINNLKLDIHSTYQQREGTYTSFENGKWGKETDYEPFWLFDSKLSYKYRNYGIFASVSNIFDIHYYDIGNVQQPGRTFKIGLSFQTGF